MLATEARRVSCSETNGKNDTNRELIKGKGPSVEIAAVRIVWQFGIFMEENKSSGVHNRLGFGKQFYLNRGFAFDPWTGMKPHNPSNKESDVFSLILASPIL
ncbi:MAG: hypothetical protein ACLVJ7_18020 [Acutalibacteraceae bacterium]|jgi:hypothetical protein